GPATHAYPTGPMTRKLVLGVPLHLMLGRGGFLVHIALALVASMELGAEFEGRLAMVATALAVTAGACVFFYMIAGHHRAHPGRIAAASVPFALAIGLLPMLLSFALPQVVPRLAGDSAVLVVHTLLGTFIFGLFLAVVAIVGLEHEQAF